MYRLLHPFWKHELLRATCIKPDFGAHLGKKFVFLHLVDGKLLPNHEIFIFVQYCGYIAHSFANFCLDKLSHKTILLNLFTSYFGTRVHCDL